MQNLMRIGARNKHKEKMGQTLRLEQLETWAILRCPAKDLMCFACWFLHSFAGSERTRCRRAAWWWQFAWLRGLYCTAQCQRDSHTWSSCGGMVSTWLNLRGSSCKAEEMTSHAQALKMLRRQLATPTCNECSFFCRVESRKFFRGLREAPDGNKKRDFSISSWLHSFSG